MELRFWGVRGSIPAPGPDTVRFGGNTTCVSVLFGEYILIFDAGTGIRHLGRYLESMERYLESMERSHWQGGVFLTHYHWDHIQGLPFFAPAFRRENRFNVYGESKRGLSISDLLCEQMQAPYFPLDMDCLEGLLTFIDVRPRLEMAVIEGGTIRTVRLLHPNGAIGYRVDGPEGSVCLITDHEHPDEGLDPPVVEFVKEATVLIHDAQYGPEEKHGPRAGFGHSSWEEAARTAREAGVRRLFLIHHDPDRTDAALLDILEQAKKVFSDTEIATESAVYDVSG